MAGRKKSDFKDDENAAVDDMDDDEYYEKEPDETIKERVMGLSEMFPQSVKDFMTVIFGITTRGAKIVYRISCRACWIFFTSSIILFAPVIFETERAHMQQLEKTRKNQVLLGSNAPDHYH